MRASASSTATRSPHRRRSCSGKRSSATSSTARRSSSTSSSRPGLSKWGETSRLTLLLPHGYEGNGPEHSSARLERFLQLAAQENIRIVNCTTSAQYFHLLRKQALDVTARPLVVMTPKGLLRMKQASSSLDDLARGEFQPVIDDPSADHTRVTRLVLCQGKIYYDIVGHEDRERATSVAVARIEQLYPFPVEQAAALLRGYPNLREVVWAQEEPQNMGAWRPIRHRLEEAKPEGVPLLYVGRPWRASPSEGYPTAHCASRTGSSARRSAVGLGWWVDGTVLLRARSSRCKDRIVRAALAPSALSWLAS